MACLFSLLLVEINESNIALLASLGEGTLNKGT